MFELTVDRFQLTRSHGRLSLRPRSGGWLRPLLLALLALLVCGPTVFGLLSLLGSSPGAAVGGLLLVTVILGPGVLVFTGFFHSTTRFSVEVTAGPDGSVADRLAGVRVPGAEVVAIEARVRELPARRGPGLRTGELVVRTADATPIVIATLADPRALEAVAAALSAHLREDDAAWREAVASLRSMREKGSMLLPCATVLLVGALAFLGWWISRLF